MPTTAQNHKDLVSLRDYVESRLDAIKATMEASDKAMEFRLESMNEFRDQINTERRAYITRSEHELIHNQLADDIRMLRESKAKAEGKASIGVVLASIAIMLTVIQVVLSAIY